jgi:hypothetical protein
MFNQTSAVPGKFIKDKEFRSALNFWKSFKSPAGCKVTIKTDCMDEDQYKNWFILLSKEVNDPKIAIKVNKNSSVIKNYSIK